MTTKQRSIDQRPERLEARISHEEKQLLQRAADLRGQTLSGFLIESARRAAEETIRERTIITLSERDSRVFLDALLHPEPAGPRLRAAAGRYRTLMGDQ